LRWRGKHGGLPYHFHAAEHHDAARQLRLRSPPPPAAFQPESFFGFVDANQHPISPPQAWSPPTTKRNLKP
jgi:hypothetical protein